MSLAAFANNEHRRIMCATNGSHLVQSYGINLEIQYAGGNWTGLGMKRVIAKHREVRSGVTSIQPYEVYTSQNGRTALSEAHQGCKKIIKGEGVKCIGGCSRWVR